jgi:hypothetical protein
MALVHQLPPNAIFSTFSIGRMELPYVALAAIVPLFFVVGGALRRVQLRRRRSRTGTAQPSLRTSL